MSLDLRVKIKEKKGVFYGRVFCAREWETGRLISVPVEPNKCGESHFVFGETDYTNCDDGFTLTAWRYA